MKVLKIKDKQGYFLTDKESYDTLENLDKTSFLHLVTLSLSDDYEIDEYNDIEIGNQAHQIIYKSISEKLNDLHKKRVHFKDESESLFKDEYDKYK